ncbi:hypothetical protein, conserved [Plasmodium gonderi]|uniref:Dynein axonemal assembly factor 11-like CS domain-containing protein n=1 Tax=Plasmodium gonderi TaxID=77519 RepID=A0A1Y1JR00_PLAGO|nr:hypothetical protein, conserved [Plasmodium gonderi]GAW83657.1 hypothetical protein, conserved [Plasmodium gonderi]
MKIDLDLIKKKSEHNEGLIEDLEEIALHQLQINKIEFINIHCRNLKILLLQNNLIEKIENLNQLKKLEYLNLAINNITLVENLEGCESLRKLDLTLNFIDISNVEISISNLKKNENLKELYLMGNPCAKWEYLKLFIILHLEHLEVLDGSDILVSDKIRAKQKATTIMLALENEKKNKKKNGSEQNEHYDNINNRKKIYAEIEKEEMERRKNEENKDNNKKEILSLYNDDGDIRQCNEGHYKFMFDEYSSNKYTFLKLFLPKYLCNSLIKIDINVNYIRCIIKNKLFQLKLNDSILTDLSKISRKKYTGELHIKMRKKNYKKNKIFEKDYLQEGDSNKNGDFSPDICHLLPSSGSRFGLNLDTSISDSSNSDSSSSDSSNSSFFKKEYPTYPFKKRNTPQSTLTLPNARDGNFFLEEKQTKYSSSLMKGIPLLEKISKRGP